MNPTEQLPQHRQLFYAGQWQDSDKRVNLTNPADQSSLGDVANASSEQVEAAIKSAHQAFKSWKAVSPQERANLLRLAANRLRANKQRLALIDSLDGGNPVGLMTKDVDHAATCFDYYAGLILELKGEVIPTPDNQLNYSVREPLGVIACLLAFNHPALFVGWTISAALAAGNTVIVKPAEHTPLSALYIAELLADIFPAGVFNVLTGDRNVGPLITQNELIKKVMFIGSIETGQAILTESAKHIRPTTLEMGGKNALIIYPDTDPMKAAQTAIAGMNFAWCGQSCGSTSRVFIHESIHDEVLKQMIAIAKTVTPGLPTNESTIMGCLASRAHYEKVLNYIEIGKQEGAHLAYGGTPPNSTELVNGNFIEPTIFSGVKQSMRIAQEEIFGPVVSVLSWDDEDEMLEEVNSVRYGLTGAIMTNDINKAHQTARKIESGYIWINQAGPHFLGAPFGGQKQSGLGRLGCLQTLLDCTQLKNINVAFD